jgi:chromosome segregation ATPase
MAEKKRKKRLPSQYKYDQSHPTVSFRLPAPLRDRLKQHLKAQSFASFVICHLEEEEAQVKARVEQLAGERDNLKATILNLRRQAEELGKQVEQRHREMVKPLEEGRARLQKEIDAWYRQEKAYNETRLETLRSQVREAKDEVHKAQLDLVFVETKKKVVEAETQRWLKERETWVRRMQQATEFINRCPWFFCHQCPGAAFNQLLLNMMNTVTSLAPGGEEAEDNSRPNELPPSGSQTST